MASLVTVSAVAALAVIGVPMTPMPSALKVMLSALRVLAVILPDIVVRLMVSASRLPEILLAAVVPALRVKLTMSLAISKVDVVGRAILPEATV